MGGTLKSWVATAALLLVLVSPLAASRGLPPDESEALQRQVDALPEGGVLTLEGRAYRFQGLRITRSLTVQGKGPGRTVVVRRQPKPFFQITGKTAVVTVQQLALEGGGLAAAGLEVSALGTLRLSDLRVSACGVPPAGSLANDSQGKPVDGVYARDVDRAEVFRCVFERNARDGFIGIPVRHLYFTQNQCRGNGRMGCTSDLDAENRVGGPLSAEYRDNEVSDCGTGGLHVESDPRLPVVECLFEGNRVSACGNRDWGYSWGLVLGCNAKGVLRGNTVTGTGLQSALKAYRNGIHVSRPGGPVLLEQNTVRDSGRSGIGVSDSDHEVVLRNNTVTGSLSEGLSFYRVPKLRMEGCTVEGSRTWGVWCRLCGGAVFLGNRFKANSQEGPGKYAAVRLESSAGARFTGNDFGGPPHAQGLELEFRALGPLTHLEGNTFEGKRSHPRLSSFKTSN
jgi:parallel beta-helix repeat protein